MKRNDKDFMTGNEYVISYKNPKIGKLYYVTVFAINDNDAIKQTSKEIVYNNKPYFRYGVSLVKRFIK